MGSTSSRLETSPADSAPMRDANNNAVLTTNDNNVDEPLSPLWKATGAAVEDTGSLPCPLACTLHGARHKTRHVSQTLYTTGLGQDNRLTIETGLRGGVLLLRLAGDDDHQILAISKNQTIYNTTPCYPDQPPCPKTRYRGTRLYEYARVETTAARQQTAPHLVYLARPGQTTSSNKSHPSFTIAPGPANSQTKRMFGVDPTTRHPDLDAVCEWTYTSPNYAVSIHQPGVDVGLVLLLALVSDLMDADAQMRDLGMKSFRLLF